MNKIRKIINSIVILVSLALVLTITGTYATWYYVEGTIPRTKTTTASINFLFPMPIGGLTIAPTDTLPKTSDNLWGAADENGEVTNVTQARENLLKAYTPFEIGVNNQTDDKSTPENEGKDLLISFRITLCLAPSLIEGNRPSYPFQDAYTITKNGETIGSGNIYFPAGDTTGNVVLEKGEYAFSKTIIFFKTDYYYYTATIDPSTIEGFDIEKFVVHASDPIASFVLAVSHTQSNDTACFAKIEIIATEYPPTV